MQPAAPTPTPTPAPAPAAPATLEPSSADPKAVAADDDEDDGLDDVDDVDDGGTAPHGGVQRNLGFGPRVGGAWGFGAGVRTGHPHVGVDFSGGWQPLLPEVTPPGSEEGELTLIHSWRLNLLAYVAFNPDSSSFVAGASGGYSYNSVLGRGGVLAFDGVVGIGDHYGFHFHAGIGIYPDADERMRRELDIPEDSDIGIPAFQIPIGIGLIIYP